MSKRIVIRRGVLPRPEAKLAAAMSAYAMSFSTLHVLERFFLRGEEYVKVGEEAAVTFTDTWRFKVADRRHWLTVRNTEVVQVDRDMPKVRL